MDRGILIELFHAQCIFEVCRKQHKVAVLVAVFVAVIRSSLPGCSKHGWHRAAQLVMMSLRPTFFPATLIELSHLRNLCAVSTREFFVRSSSNKQLIRKNGSQGYFAAHLS
jgi:hypothetical protein